jgi:hypothetical protein
MFYSFTDYFSRFLVISRVFLAKAQNQSWINLEKIQDNKSSNPTNPGFDLWDFQVA